MIPHIPEKFSTRLIDRSPFVIMGQMPPEIPDEDRRGRGRDRAGNRRSCASRTKTELNSEGAEKSKISFRDFSGCSIFDFATVSTQTAVGLCEWCACESIRSSK